MRVSYLQIYNERLAPALLALLPAPANCVIRISDLLSSGDDNLKVRERGSNDPYVEVTGTGEGRNACS